MSNDVKIDVACRDAIVAQPHADAPRLNLKAAHAVGRTRAVAVNVIWKVESNDIVAIHKQIGAIDNVRHRAKDVIHAGVDNSRGDLHWRHKRSVPITSPTHCTGSGIEDIGPTRQREVVLVLVKYIDILYMWSCKVLVWDTRKTTNKISSAPLRSVGSAQ